MERLWIVFSDDFDKALASFVIANGAASTGKKVTMFFTFWGLSVVKKTAQTIGKQGFHGQDVWHDAAVMVWTN